MEIQELKDKMNYYNECSDELINFGNSREQALGQGMKDIINIVKLYTNEK
jgi:hypothetical protein